jgi:uncharacterized membrane protein YedE/YeeE
MTFDGVMPVLQPLLGGAVIGMSAIALLALHGRIAGVSGIVGGIVSPRRGDVAWRACFVAGLVVGGLALRAFFANPFGGLRSTPYGEVAFAGLLVGFGASLGSGCTSGHGVCGIGRLSPRSLVATMTFMLAGALTVFAVRHGMPTWP